MSNNILRFKKDGKYVPVDVNAENVLLKNQAGEYTGENLENLLGEYHNLEKNYTPRLNMLESSDQSIAAQLAQTENRMNGIVINAMYPPAPFNPIKSDANYYDETNFKYYKDVDMTTPATDNKPMVQALVNYLAENGGGRLFIPSGKYAFRSSVQWESKVSLRGASKISTQLFAEGNLFSLIEGLKGSSNGGDYALPNVWFEDCEFTEFLIDNKGLSHTEPSVGGKGLFILYMKRSMFKNLILLNTIGTALGCDFLVDTVIDNIFTDRAGRNSILTGGHGGNSGIGIGTSALSKEPIVVSNCFTYNSGNYGVFVETQMNPDGLQAKYAKIVNCHAQGNRLGFGNKGSGGTNWVNCSAVGNRSHGFHLTQESSGDSILGCISEGNIGDGIRVEATYLGDLEIANTKTNSNGGSGFRAVKNLGILKRAKLTNISSHDNGEAGIWFGGGIKDLLVAFVNASNNGQRSDLAIKFKRGILIEGQADIVAVLNNTVYDDQETATQTGGIDISEGTKNLVLDGNNVVGFSELNSYIIRTEDVTYGTNAGINQEVSGTVSFPVGVNAVYINHYLGKPVNSITLTPLGNNNVWVIGNSEINRIRVQRDGVEGELEVMYKIAL